METIADLINEVVTNIKDENILKQVKQKVHQLMEGRALFNG